MMNNVFGGKQTAGV